MKVLLISPLPPPSGGIARWTERYIKWCKNKHQVLVVNTALMGNRAGEAGINRNLLEEIRRAQYIIDATKKQLKKSPDIVHLNTSCSKFGIIRDWICVKIAIKRGVPIFVHCHCNIEDQLGTGLISNILFKDIVRKSKKVLVLNEKSKLFVSKIVNKLDKVIICPNFIELEQILTRREDNEKIERVIYVGDVRKSKGSDDLYKLAARLPNIKFILVGSVTEEMKTIEKPDNINLLGRIDAFKVREQLQNADIFIFPSLTEGFSNAMLEAMSVGLPIIATNVGANQDMIEDKGGMIVSVHDIEGMQIALQKMKTKSVRQEMSDWNLKKVIENYEYNCVLEKIFQIYEENMYE